MGFGRPTVGKVSVLESGFKDLMRKKRRESGWNNNFIPIAAYNEKVHSSMRVPFE